jgi:hypothetical protein
MVGAGKVRLATMKKSYIKLEPHTAFKKAIVRESKDGCITYSYDLLIKVCMELHDWDEQTAVEWVDYNILGFACNGFKVSYARAR